MTVTACTHRYPSLDGLMICKKVLVEASLLVLLNVSGSYHRGTNLERSTEARIVETESFILSLDCVSTSSLCVGLARRLPFDSMVTFCKSCGAILRDQFLLIKERFLFGILRLLDRKEARPLLAFVSIAPLRESDWTAISDQCWFSYECNGEMLIF